MSIYTYTLLSSIPAWNIPAQLEYLSSVHGDSPDGDAFQAANLAVWELNQSENGMRRNFRLELLAAFNEGLVASAVRMYVRASSQADSDDFRQAAYLGLSCAMDSYDPSQGRFSTWAHRYIGWELQDAVRLVQHPQLGQTHFKARPQVLAAVASGSLTEWVGSSEARSNAAHAVVVGAPSSLDAMVEENGATALSSSVHAGELPSVVADFSDALVDCLADEEVLHAAGRIIADLDEREREVLCSYLGIGAERESFAAIGKRLGVSRETARSLHNKALVRVREAVAA